MAEGVTQFADGLFSRSKALHFPCRDRQVVEIDADAELNTAFTVLVTHNLICAPVWDATQGGYIGWFDVDDALNIVADIDLISSATASDDSAPCLIPRMKRPTARCSNNAEFAATRTGCC